uniref:Reverse transcriptase domain-containing protein n=1 Tax=Haemonchus contortus TaxID=6289 RepID=A0A7I4Z7N0_HAECO
MFIDLKKASDTVETEAVIEALGNQGVPTQYIRMIHDIVLITPNIEQAERMLAEFDSACGGIGLRLNSMKTIFMKNGLVPDAPFTLNGKNISECSSDVYLGREANTMNDLAPELCRRKRAAWGSFKNIEGVVKKPKIIRLHAHLFDTAVLPALTYASETWTLRKQDKHAVSVIPRASERTMLGIPLYAQVQKRIRVSSSVIERRS